jgi:hypothetical protein
MMKNIIGQSIYMVAVLLVILLAGEYFIPEDCYIKEDSDNPGHMVLVVSKRSITFVMRMGM